VADKKNGWIKLYRSIRNHWLWRSSKPFTYGQAWVDMLLTATYSHEECGELVATQSELCYRWGWSRQKLRGFLAKLEHDESISLFSTSRATKITICKYIELQSNSTRRATPKQPTNNQPTTNQTDDNSIYTNEEGRRKKEEYLLIGEIKFKQTFVKSKMELFPMLDVVGEMRKCVNWHTSKGRNIKDWNRAVSNWLSIAFDRSGVIGKVDDNEYNRYYRGTKRK